MLLIVSRGIVEAEFEGQEFGLDGGGKPCRVQPLETAADLCGHVLAAAQEFMKVPPTHNDATTLALLRIASLRVLPSILTHIRFAPVPQTWFTIETISTHSSEEGMKLTPGKLAGLRKVSNERGVIAAAAMDQRGSLQKSLQKEKGGEVSDAMMEEFKTLVTEVLTPHASAILLDPEWGLPASKRRAANAGLLLAYEKTGYDKTGPGRLGDLLDHWSVRRLKEAGADCLKILLYYTPFDPKDVNDQKHAWVERIGDECRANDIPFFLEFVGYEEGADEKGLDYAKKKPEIVAESMREFSKDRYGVDVLKVEVPINMKYVEGAKVYGGQKAYSQTEAKGLFLKAATATTKPFIYLSAGVSNAEFTEALELAAESGVKFNGVLCGRATWKDGIPIYAKQGATAFRQWLESEGVTNINNVNERLKAATSWFPSYGVEPVHDRGAVTV